MKQAATGLNQQGHTELHKRHKAFVKGGMGIQNVLQKNCLNNDTEHWTLEVTVHFFSTILKYGIKML